MLKEFEERIQNAKDKQFRIFERFHVGDAVYPFWLKGFIVYGIVTDIDTIARKIYCDFNGVRRQFCPEDLMLVNPELINASTVKKRNASEEGTYSKHDETHLSPDTDNGIEAICDKCGGEIAVSYDEKTATSDFVCTKCGERIPESELSDKSKKAMREQMVEHMRCARENAVESPSELKKYIEKHFTKYPQMHPYCLLPSGNWFSTEIEKDNSLDCYITDSITPDGFPPSSHNNADGWVLKDCGNCDDVDECDDMARHVFQEDNMLQRVASVQSNDGIARELACVAKDLIRYASDGSFVDAYEALDEAFHQLIEKYHDRLDYDMGWEQDIGKGVIYINYYSGLEKEEGFEVTFNISYEDGSFTVAAVYLDGDIVAGYDTYSSLDELVQKFKNYFPVVDEYLRNKNGSGIDADASDNEIAKELVCVAKMLMKLK